MDSLVPARVFLTKGVGRHRYQLKSFEEALRQAGVAQQNLVQVSSILPPKCKVIARENGLKSLVPGQITYCATGAVWVKSIAFILPFPALADFQKP